MQIEREAEKQYFQIRDEVTEDMTQPSDFREQMLLNNHIEGILDFTVNIKNNEKMYEFNISELESLDAICRRERLGMDKLAGIMDDLLQTVFRGREFMLSEDDYILDPNLIFIDRKGKTHIAYHSGYKKALTEQLQNLASYLMDKINYDDDQAVLLVYSTYMKTKDGSCSLEELISFTRKKAGRTSGMPQIKKVGGPEFRSELELKEISSDTVTVPEIQLQKNNGNNAAVPEIVEEHGSKRDFVKIRELWRVGSPQQKIESIAALIIPAAGAFFILNSEFCMLKGGGRDGVKSIAVAVLMAGIVIFLQKKIWGSLNEELNRKSVQEPESGKDEETVLLFQDDRETHTDCCLVSDEYPGINITRYPFYIGRDGAHCDYCLDVPGISRAHLKIERVGTEYMVSDLNSTNGTFLNDERLAPNKPYRISRMDKITIGSCVFYVNK